ncbi:MAG TPA: YlxR family protein [Nocardioidaceae bacterium]|nr:YlxR family protein [Nocardioidaceae bacterium]
MSSDAVRGSVRTCVGCRERAERRELLRVVAGDRGSGLEVLPDPAGRAPGRGAHLHPTPECLDLAVRRRAFPRALKVQGRLATTAVEDFVRGSRHGPAQPSTTGSTQHGQQP